MLACHAVMMPPLLMSVIFRHDKRHFRRRHAAAADTLALLMMPPFFAIAYFDTAIFTPCFADAIIMPLIAAISPFDMRFSMFSLFAMLLTPPLFTLFARMPRHA